MDISDCANTPYEWLLMYWKKQHGFKSVYSLKKSVFEQCVAEHQVAALIVPVKMVSFIFCKIGTCYL